MTYVPHLFTRDGEFEVSETPDEGVRLTYDGWVDAGELPTTIPPIDRTKTLATLANLDAALESFVVDTEGIAEAVASAAAAASAANAAASAAAAAAAEASDAIDSIGDALDVLDPDTPAGHVFTSTGTSLHSRPSEKADVRDFAADTGGVFGTGDADKDTACILDALAASEAEYSATITGGRPIHIPAGIAYLAAPIVRSQPVPVHGSSLGRTILRPTIDMASQWMWTDDDMNREGSVTFTGTTYDPLVNDGYAELQDITFLSDRASPGRYHGYRTKNSNDDLRHRRLLIFGFNGVGYRIGDPAPDSAGGTVRESTFDDVRVSHCGDGPDWDAVQITQADAVPLGGGGDGTNQLNFNSCWFVVNWGTVRVGTGSADEVMRRTNFLNLMLHGIPPSGGDTGCDVMTIEGRISGVAMLGLRTNSSPAGKACIRWKGKNGYTPGNQTVTGFHATSMPGSLFAIDDVESIILQGHTGPGDIGEWELVVAAESTVTPGTPAIGSAIIEMTTASASRKISVPANSWENTAWNSGRMRRNASTAVMLNSVTDEVNLIGKRKGRMIFNTNLQKPVWAVGAAATDVWKDATGAVTNTPV